MKLQLFYRFDKLENGDRWKINFTDSSVTGFLATIAFEDVVKIFYKVKPGFTDMPSTFFFVTENDPINVDSEKRYTIVPSIDALSEARWLNDEDAYNEIMALIRPDKYNKKYKVLIGSDDESRVKQMIKMVEFLDFSPIVIPGNGNYDSIVSRERLHHLLNDVDFVFYPRRHNDSYTIWFSLESKICDQLGIPFYNMDEMEDMIVKKALGEEVKINVAKNNDKSIVIDTDANSRCWWSDGEPIIRNHGSANRFSRND